MDNNMKAVFELSRAAMLAVENGRIVLANGRAEELFGRELSGKPAFGIVPDHILTNKSDSFVSTALIEDNPYCVSASHSGGTLYLSIASERSSGTQPEFVSEKLMGNMLSTLFNIGLAIDRVSAETADKSSKKLDSYLAIMNHSYYELRHSLLNLNTSMALRRGSLPFMFRTVDLARLCSDIVSTVSALCANMGIAIEFSTPLGELYAYADGEKVERIILNIITNSLAHTPRGGKIVVKLEKVGDNAHISVSDNGSGIPAAEMPELFTAYERSLRASDLSAMPGGGLGLGVARGLAEGHGGALLVESREGKGTSVRILLPLQSNRLCVFEDNTEIYSNSGMGLILTELSGVLGNESYIRRYME